MIPVEQHSQGVAPAGLQMGHQLVVRQFFHLGMVRRRCRGPGLYKHLILLEALGLVPACGLCHLSPLRKFNLELPLEQHVSSRIASSMNSF